jgi:outer membrane protein assembly factor BamD
MLKVAEAEMRQMGLSDRDITHARKAEQRLKVLLQQYPDTPLRAQVETHLREVQDNLAMHKPADCAVLFRRALQSQKGRIERLAGPAEGSRGKVSELLFDGRVLFRYATTFQEEEEPDEAAKLYQQLVRDYPNSEYVEKAKEQLNIIGASIPDPDPIKKALPPCEKPSFMENVMQQISGSANITASRDGILITRHGEGVDLIDKAITNNGELPENVQPIIQRNPPKPAPSVSNAPAQTRPRETQTPTPKP